MPIYEFGCPACKKIFQFWTTKIGADEVPSCPKCGGGNMQKAISSFSIGKGGQKMDTDSEAQDSSDPFANMPPEQQAHMEKEMMKLMGGIDSIDENDPRQMGAFMRKLAENTGMDHDPRMNEAIRRLEKGEDPERIEEEMGDLFGDFDEMNSAHGGMDDWSYDDSLYDM